MHKTHVSVICIALLVLAGCDDSGDGGADTSTDTMDLDTAGEDVSGEDPVEEEVDTTPPPASEDWSRDILSTALDVDIASMSGTATIRLAPADSTGASFDVQGLTVTDVSGPTGALDWLVTDGRLDVGVVPGGDHDELTVDYTFLPVMGFEGWMMANGVTLIWPYWCGNLFPCHPDPADGTTFALALTGVDPSDVAVYPETIPTDAPSYQIAWAIGDYAMMDVGTTSAGTHVVAWYLPGSEAATAAGTANLVAVVEWYETVLGPYPFGDTLGPVQAHWPPGAYGGMEHHPLWHVSTSAMGDESVHAHEAAHGWYGDGIRIECWEDFVLSEGTVSYLEARSMGQAIGPASEASVWAAYEAELAGMTGTGDGIAWPDSCGEVDIIEDGLFSRVPYIKGAYFFRAVADEVGAETLDLVLADFYVANVGQAARMQDLLDLIYSQTGFDPSTLAEEWLRTLGHPPI